MTLSRIYTSVDMTTFNIIVAANRTRTVMWCILFYLLCH